ncbi:hypothetical protein DMP15_29905 [Pseudonocardia sp. UM4_GMWB1]
MATIYVGDRLISAGQILPDGRDAVLVSRGRIEAVGKAAELIAAAPEASVSRFAGYSITPGLINSHVHLAGDCSTSSFATLCSGAPDEVRAVIRGNARACLRAGCTTVRDLGDARGYVARFRDATQMWTAYARGSCPQVLRSRFPADTAGISAGSPIQPRKSATPLIAQPRPPTSSRSWRAEAT